MCFLRFISSFKVMEDECTLPGDTDFGLLCTENREFLYNGEGVTPPGSMTSDSLHGFDDDESNMATSFGESSLGESIISSKASSSSLQTDGERPKKTRKRNSVRDKMRSAAEQNAYKKLRDVVPSLTTVKKPTKLQTIRHTLKFIERLQDRLYTLEKQSSTGDGSEAVEEVTAP